ncbi:hypothetical protein MPER_07057, partial [Moniliophthora perniciosa FA553]
AWVYTIYDMTHFDCASCLSSLERNAARKWVRLPLRFKMGGAGWLFLFAVLMAAALLFCMVFFIIMFSDLECDYINPIDLCNKLNQFVLPENIAHAFLTLLFLISGQWMAFLLNAPLLVFNANKIRNKNHMYDATEIFDIT